MKKFVFFCVAMGFGLFVNAQNKSVSQDLNIIRPNFMNITNDHYVGGPVKPSFMHNSLNKSITEIYLGTSLNVFGTLTSDQNCLAVNTATNTIGFIHRSGGGWQTTNNVDLRLKFTSDIGLTWDSLQIPGTANAKFRYPGGAIYNKTGNIDPTKLYLTYSGPTTNGTAFQYNDLGSARFDSTNVHTLLTPYGPANTYLNHMDERMQICDNKWVHVSSTHYVTSGSSGTFDKFQVVNGLFDETADSVVWGSPVDIVPPLLSIGGYFGEGMAWSKDGSIGYFYVIAKDSNGANNSAMPILWQSTDNGATWSGPTYYDFGTIASIHHTCWPTLSDTGVVIPFFCAADNSSGAVVDQNNKLHIFCTVKGLSTTWQPDSIGYTYTYENPHLMDAYMTSSGWDARFVSEIYTATVKYTDAEAITSSPNNVGWDHRISMTKIEDGSKLFYFWVDQPDSNIASSGNVAYPDLFGQGYDINTTAATLVTYFTQFSSLSMQIFFHFIGDRVLISGPDYVIPVTTTVPTNNSADDAPNHYFLKGVTFTDADFLPIGTAEHTPQTSSCSLYPNPANNHAVISLSHSSSEKVKVNVYDLVGQKVFSKDYGILGAGNQNLKINTAGFTSGIYMVSIQTNNERITRKLIIEK